MELDVVNVLLHIVPTGIFTNKVWPACVIVFLFILLFILYFKKKLNEYVGKCKNTKINISGKADIKALLFAVAAILCVLVLLFSLYNGLIIYIPQKQEEKQFGELQQMVSQVESQNDTDKFSELIRMNSDFRGWLKIKDTGINYPVVLPPGNDSEYYLHRDFNKNYSYSGTPFLDTKSDENSDVFIIYAHNMKTDAMFGTLDNYEDKEWADSHCDIVFETPDSKNIYRVFAAFKTKIGSDNEFKYYEKTGNYNNDEDYFDFISQIQKNSIIDIDEKPKQKTQILLLSTCSYFTDNGRFVVAAYKIN